MYIHVRGIGLLWLFGPVNLTSHLPPSNFVCRSTIVPRCCTILYTLSAQTCFRTPEGLTTDAAGFLCLVADTALPLLGVSPLFTRAARVIHEGCPAVSENLCWRIVIHPTAHTKPVCGVDAASFTRQRKADHNQNASPLQGGHNPGQRWGKRQVSCDTKSTNYRTTCFLGEVQPQGPGLLRLVHAQVWISAPAETNRPPQINSPLTACPSLLRSAAIHISSTSQYTTCQYPSARCSDFHV